MGTLARVMDIPKSKIKLQKSIDNKDI